VRRAAQLQLSFAFGVVFVLVLLALALAVPSPTDFQYAVFRIVLALAAAGVAAMLPGSISARIPIGVGAAGALAVFSIVYFFSPAAVVIRAKEGPPSIPGHTGWVFLGYFRTADSTFDATGPLFDFERRLRRSGPFIPSPGDLIRINVERHVMIHRFKPNRSTENAMDLICVDYDEDRDDTDVRLPTGTTLVVRDVGSGCQAAGNPRAALWVRVAIPPA
jgi:hypothetical protein